MRNRVGVIDIGSDDITLNIAERSAGKIKTLDTLVRHLSLGQDTFLTGKISYESADKTASILSGFKQVMSEYDVTGSLAIATTAVREAENRTYILDQLKIKTGLDIKVIDNRREKILINRMLYTFLSEKMLSSALLVHLGGGTIGLTVIADGKVTDTLTIFTSALRLTKKFESRGNIDQLYYYDVIKEYFEGYLGEIDRIMDSVPESFILTGGNSALIVKMCASESGDIVERKDFNELYKKIKNKTPQQISDTYGIDAETADIMLPAIIILNRLVKYTSAEKLYCPRITISDAIAHQMLFPKETARIDSLFAGFAITSVKRTCRRYGVNIEHAERIAATALMIFDRMKKYHGLGKNERLLLELACLLQNCGKFISVHHHHRHSYNIINGLNIVGIDESQLRILALIAFYHNRDPKPGDTITPDELVIIAKLSAILRLANSVNKSYGKGFEKIDVSLKSDQLIITIHTYKNIELEKWSFLAAAPFFREVYGLEADLKKRSVM